MSKSANDPDLTEAQAARILGITERTLRRWRLDGHVAHLAMPGGRIRYTLADLVDFRQACRVPAIALPSRRI